MSRRLKSEAIGYSIPQTDVEASEYIASMGRIQNEILRHKTNTDDEILALKEDLKTKVQPLESELDSLQKGIQHYCEQNRKRLTNNGKIKSHNFTTGEVSWRYSSKVTLRNTENVIEELKKRNLNEFIRQKDEVNKEAILANPEPTVSIPGISIKSAETFAVTASSSVEG